MRELIEGVVSPHHLPSLDPVPDGGWQPEVVARARDLAESLLLPGSKRWRHSQTAAVAAAEAGRVLDDHECTLLTSAAWMHDIGYHHPTPATGFHPIDGAQLLLRAGWPTRVASLVAHHSEARFMADVRGLSAELAGWPRESGPVADGLVYADMTSAPGGGRTGVLERLAEVRRRHRGEPLGRAVARRRREPFLVMAAARTDLALRRAGYRGHFAHPSRPEVDVPAGVAEQLSHRHPGRTPVDVAAALHGASAVVDPSTPALPARLLELADHLLLASQSPAAPAVTPG